MDSANEDRLKRQEKMQKSIWFSSVGNSGGVYQFRWYEISWTKT